MEGIQVDVLRSNLVVWIVDPLGVAPCPGNVLAYLQEARVRGLRHWRGALSMGCGCPAGWPSILVGFSAPVPATWAIFRFLL